MSNSTNPNLIIIRGSSSVGKSTISTSLKESLLCEGKKVALFHWDDFCHLISPISMTRSGIIKTTQALVKALLQFNIQDPHFVFIIDGVFILPEEHKIIKSLQDQFELSSFLLTCDEKIQLSRNRSRNPEDFLEENRIRELNQFIMGNKLIPNEVILQTDTRNIKDISRTIFNSISFRNIKNNKENVKTDYAFVHSKLWRFGQIARYHGQIWKKIDGDIFVYDSPKKLLKCLTPFYPSFGLHGIEDSLNRIFQEFPHEVDKISFQYVDNTHPLVQSAEKFQYGYAGNSLQYLLTTENKWKAPILKLNNNQDLLNNSRLLRTLKKGFNHTEGDIKYENVLGMNHRMEAWEQILLLDICSWKGQSNSDMSQLNREDLCYLPVVLCEEAHCSLYIAKLNQEVLAWSLFLRASHAGSWFAVKWGASEKGREYFAGIKLLHRQLYELRAMFMEDFGSDSDFKVDFWGRDSEVYNQFANYSQDRFHLSLELKRSL